MQNLDSIIASVFIICVCFSNANTSDSPYILESKSLPEDLNFMPTLGNGHLGFTLFGDSILVNGIYNGKGGRSHRARLPNIGNISLTPMGTESYTKQTYKLDLYTGIFERKQSNSEIETIVRTYPHRYYNRAIINEVFVQRIANTSATPRDLKFHITTHPGHRTDDFIPLSLTSNSNEKQVLFCDETKDLENPDIQSQKPHICVALNIWSTNITLPFNETNTYLRLVVVVAETAAIAMRELNDAASSEYLLSSHSDLWKSFWNDFHIDLDDNLPLSRTINAGIFYIASSLPSSVTNQNSFPFYGLSPTGLGRGFLESDYQGHNFWDTEIWMLPVVTQLSLNWTRELLSYRFRKLDAAIDNAKEHNNTGARFPWESALTGTEVTNPCCPEVAEQQLHITADIAFATRHYFAVTNDTVWMEREGCELSRRIAEFWVSRVSADEKTGQYDIKYVMGPDEDHVNVTNNVYTNLAVHHSLEFVYRTQSICGTDLKFAANCLRIAERLKVPYDPVLDYHPQYEGYTPDVTIKQADAVLLSYPMMYPMKMSTLSNNLRIYENVTRSSGPAMTWSMHAIGHLDEGNKTRAHDLFKKGYRDYVREPFKVWSEVIIGEEGAVNFLTGIGGFLQAIINGYGGIRFHSDRMEVKKPSLIAETKGAVISGIKYQGSVFIIKISNQSSIAANYIKTSRSLHLVDEDNNSQLMAEGVEYLIERTIFIKSVTISITAVPEIKKGIYI